MIKEFCGGKAGWNDRAIFIETVLQASVQNQSVATLRSVKSMAKVMPNGFALCSIRSPIEPSVLGDLPNATPRFSSHVSLLKVPWAVQSTRKAVGLPPCSSPI